MSIKDVLPKSEATLEAQKIAENIFNKKPEVQREMLTEIKKHLVRLNNNNAEQLQSI